jgi:hypothetical protein
LQDGHGKTVIELAPGGHGTISPTGGHYNLVVEKPGEDHDGVFTINWQTK